MTTGQHIKQVLGLEKYDNIFIAKGLRSGGKGMYFIFFNSKFPNASINHTKILRHQKMDIYRGEHIKRDIKQRVEYFPFESLDLFDKDIANDYIVLYDLCDYNRSLRYDFFTESTEEYTKLMEYAYTDAMAEDMRLLKYCKKFEGKLEEITIPELKQVNSLTSDLTKKYKDIRDEVQGRANTNTKFLKTEIIGSSGSIRFYFITEATSVLDKQGKVGHKVTGESKKQFNPETNKLEPNPSQTYTLMLQLENVLPNNTYKGEPWIYVYDGEAINSKLILDLINVADVKLFSTDPSYTYQGFSYKLTNLSANIYPNTIPDSHWRAKHGDAVLTKHWNSLLSAGYIEFVSNQLAVSLFSQLKKLGYVDSKTKILTAHPEN